MKDSLIRDALYNLHPKAGASPEYGRGIVVGVTTALMAAYDWEFERAFKQVIQRCPDRTRIACFPEEWRGRAVELVVFSNVDLV